MTEHNEERGGGGNTPASRSPQAVRGLIGSLVRRITSGDPFSASAIAAIFPPDTRNPDVSYRDFERETPYRFSDTAGHYTFIIDDEGNPPLDAPPGREGAPQIRINANQIANNAIEIETATEAALRGIRGMRVAVAHAEEELRQALTGVEDGYVTSDEGGNIGIPPPPLAQEPESDLRRLTFADFSIANQHYLPAEAIGLNTYASGSGQPPRRVDNESLDEDSLNQAVTDVYDLRGNPGFLVFTDTHEAEATAFSCNANGQHISAHPDDTLQINGRPVGFVTTSHRARKRVMGPFRTTPQVRTIKRHRQAKFAARRKARKLLRRFTTPEQWREYLQKGAVTVETKNAIYTLTPNWIAGVRCHPKRKGYRWFKRHKPALLYSDRLCIQPSKNVPTEDMIVAQKLLLENDEERFLKIAIA